MPLPAVYNLSMKTQEYLIHSSYITARTSLPLYTEEYRYTAHLSEAAHSHEFLEIGILLAGQMLHKTERGSRLLTEGCVYFIPDGHSHALEPDPGLIVRNLYLLPKIFLSDAAEESTPVMLQDFLLYFTDPGRRQTAEIRLPREQLTAVRSLLEACDVPPCCDLLADAFRYHCLMNVLLLLCDSFGRACPECLVRKDARIYRILRLIRENLSLPTGELLRTISAELFLNPQYVNRLIKKELHTTLSALILDTRIEKSCELLLKGHTITETAAALAFYDHSHFHKAFVRKLGMTPSEYQKKTFTGP